MLYLACDHLAVVVHRYVFSTRKKANKKEIEKKYGWLRNIHTQDRPIYLLNNSISL